METSTAKPVVTIETTVQAPVAKVWNYWNDPAHITRWNSPSPDWHTPRSTNDLRVGGQLLSRMEAKDGSMGFDFGATYDEIRPNEYIEYTIGDGRKVKITFAGNGNSTHIVESFEAESMNPVDFQRAGWQAILDSFTKYTETH